MTAPTNVAATNVRGRRAITARERALLGGVGGLAPVLLNFTVADPAKVFVAFSLVVCAGYVLRIAALFALGALVAWAHKQERNTLRLFELGIIAPALMTALINGAAARGEQAPKAGTGTAMIEALVLPKTAWAQARGSSRSGASDSVYSFASPPETRVEQFWRGLTGITSRDRWFVVLEESVRSREKGFAIIDQLKQRQGVRARLYRRGGPREEVFVVVLADWLDRSTATEEARRLRNRNLPALAWSLPR